MLPLASMRRKLADWVTCDTPPVPMALVVRMKALLPSACALLALALNMPAAEVPAASKRIDALLAADWQKQGIQPNPPAGDEVFLRRAYLTVIGRIPTYDEARAFLESEAPDKRARLVDALLASEGYVHHFFNYWSDVLRAQTTGVAGSTTAQNYLNYLRESLRANKPYDQLVRELVSSEGTCFDTGAIGYYMRDRGMPLDNLSNTTRVFLGTRMECAQCHDHPFDKWTQKQFYEMAAFTHNMTSGAYRSTTADRTNNKIREDKSLDKETQDLMRQAITEVVRPLRDTQVVQNKTPIRLPHDYKYSDAKPKDVVPAAVMFGKPVQLTKESDPSAVFADWLTSPDNPRFTHLIANRLWKKVFGLALIEPFDELTDASTASNPELMKFLERQMVELRYDMKAFLRVLLNTETFGRTSTREVGMGEPYHFPGPVFRRMTAEQAWDSVIALVSPVPDQPNWSSRERERIELEKRGLLAKMLDKTEPELLFEAAREVAGAMREQNKEFDQLRKELDAARAAEDKDKINDIQRRLGQSQRILRETVSRCFHAAAAKSSNAEVKALLVEMSGGGDMEMAMMNAMETPRVEARDRPLDDTLKARLEKDSVLLGLKDEKSRKSYEAYLKTLHQTWVRAAELPSPAPRGHFLREFGQSDREIIENASDEASVPQALLVMNGPIGGQVSNGWSALSLTLRRAKTADEKLDVLFLSLFSRKPAEAERAQLRQRLESYAGSKTLWEDLTLAALSTQRFLFVE
jgi:hypothetical protein